VVERCVETDVYLPFAIHCGLLTLSRVLIGVLISTIRTSNFVRVSSGRERSRSIWNSPRCRDCWENGFDFPYRRAAAPMVELVVVDNMNSMWYRNVISVAYVTGAQ
jgi:hypothetical protein